MNSSLAMIPARLIQRAASLLFLFVLLLITGCGSDQLPHFALSGSTMGTQYHITVLEQGESRANQADLQQAVDQQLQLINQQMSTYITDSELSRFNLAAVNEWVSVSPNLFEVLMLSLELGWLSNGALDITVAPLVNLWGFGPSQYVSPETVPTAAMIRQRLQRTGFQHIEFDLGTNSVRKTQPLDIDLSALAKGYGVDKVAELLSYAGYSHFMVEIGGELRLKGNSPRGMPWRIAIEQPDAGSFGQVQQVVKLSDRSMATSGDYRNFFELDGKRYSHTINPSTGYPIEHHLASVTVIAETSAYADGLATAINVMGPEQGLLLAEQQNLAVYLLIKTEQGFEAIYSDAFKPFLE